MPPFAFKFSTDLDKVLDLTNTSTLDALGIAPVDLIHEVDRFTQEICEAAHEQRFQAICSRTLARPVVECRGRPR